MDTDFEIANDDIYITHREEGPSFTFSVRFRERICIPWERTVIAKLWGKNIGYKVLMARVKALWHPTTDANFRPKSHRFTSVVAWIRFSRMPCEYYHQAILRAIRNQIGRTVRIDYYTQHAAKGKFTRVAVELDLAKPLVIQFKIDDEWQRVEYERLPQICFACSKVGHNMAFCPEKASTSGEKEQNENMAMDEAVLAKGQEDEGNFKRVSEYGLQLHAPSRQRRVVRKDNEAKFKGSSSSIISTFRFQILNENGDKDNMYDREEVVVELDNTKEDTLVDVNNNSDNSSPRESNDWEDFINRAVEARASSKAPHEAV